jgi:hypothetical protein
VNATLFGSASANESKKSVMRMAFPRLQRQVLFVLVIELLTFAISDHVKTKIPMRPSLPERRSGSAYHF